MAHVSARIVVDSASNILDASEYAIDLLGMSLDELRSLPPGGLSVEQDRAASEAFEAEWRASGEGQVAGAGTIRVSGGQLMRIRFLIMPKPDGTFEIIFDRIEEPVTAPPRTFTVGSALAAWRAAERKLETLDPASAEWAVANADVQHVRDEYQRLVRLASAGPKSHLPVMRGSPDRSS
jgi:hypothetical protein